MIPPESAENEVINILVVDDRPEGRITLEAVLNNQEYRLFQAASGIEAIKMASEVEFAVILLDVQMPGMDGFQTARRIQAIEKAGHTAIIFVTAINQEAIHVYEGYECGAVDYILKPFDPLILKSKVDVLVELYRKNKKIQNQARLLLEAEYRERSRQLAELELESLKRYRNLADAIPHIVWKARPDGRADYFNKIWTNLTGLNLQQSDGMGWKSAIHQDDLTVLMSIWDKTRKEGQKSFEAEVRIKMAADGTLRWFLVRGIAEMTPEDFTSGWILTCTDIHDRKEMEEDLGRRTTELTQLNKDLEEFAFAASHDLQEPLRKITVFCDLLKLQTAGLNGNTQDYLSRIQGAARRMSDLINNLLRYSRVTTKEEIFEPVDLNLVMQEVITTLELQIKNSGARVHADPLPTIVASRIWMSQLLQNLISNAIKFRSHHPPEIHVSAKNKGHEWRFSIKDNGIGMDPIYSNQIFGIFKRLHTREEYPGTGIGLAIVKRIVEGQKGRIWVESQPGKGSTFIFTVPAKGPSRTAITPPPIQKTDSLKSSHGNSNSHKLSRLPSLD